MIADWAPDGTLRLDSIHQYGSEALDETSPHYDDQAPLFVCGAYKLMPLSWEAVKQIAAEEYRPQDR